MKYRGGSVASDSVINKLDCQTFANLNSTNQVAGNGIGTFKFVNARGGRKMMRGGDCSAETVTTTPVLPPSGPSTPSQGTLDYTSVGQSVINALQNEVNSGVTLQNNVFFPQSMAPLNVFSI